MYEVSVKLRLTAQQVEQLGRLRPSQLLNTAATLVQELHPRSEERQYIQDITLEELKIVTPTLVQMIDTLRESCRERGSIWWDEGDNADVVSLATKKRQREHKT